jgi:hypothetical protein
MCRGFHFIWSHTITQPQSVGLLWTRDRPVAETSTWRYTILKNRQISMSPVGFKPTIPAGDRLQSHALDRSPTEIGLDFVTITNVLSHKTLVIVKTKLLSRAVWKICSIFFRPSGVALWTFMELSQWIRCSFIYSFVSLFYDRSIVFYQASSPQRAV